MYAYPTAFRVILLDKKEMAEETVLSVWGSYLGRNEQIRLGLMITHIAVSSLHFEPVDSVVWNISFREKQIQELTVELM